MAALFRKDEQQRQEQCDKVRPCWSGLVAIACGLYWLLWVGSGLTLPDVQQLRETAPRTTAFMEDAPGTPRYQWTALAEVSQHLQRAIIVAEDARFYEHPGFDWAAIRSAFAKNWEQGRFAFGASTITQQLAKNLYLSPSKNPLRKLKELGIALRLEQELPKARILELYVNVVEWAPGVYGAAAASEHYFGVAPRRLSKAQAAFLASILPNPRVLGAQGYRLTKRAKTILRRM